MVYRFHDKWYCSKASCHGNELTTCTELSQHSRLYCSPLRKLNDFVDKETRYHDTGKGLPNEAVDGRYGQTFSQLLIVTPVLLHPLVLSISEDVTESDNVGWNDAAREDIPERFTNFIRVAH